MRGDLQLHSVCLRVLVCNCERKQREDEDVLGWAVCQAGKPAGEFSKSMAKKAAKGQPAKCTVCVANPPANNPPAAAAAAAVRHPEPKVSTPAHTKHLGWYLEFEFRVTQATEDASGETNAELAGLLAAAKAGVVAQQAEATGLQVRLPTFVRCPPLPPRLNPRLRLRLRLRTLVLVLVIVLAFCPRSFAKIMQPNGVVCRRAWPNPSGVSPGTQTQDTSLGVLSELMC